MGLGCGELESTMSTGGELFVVPVVGKHRNVLLYKFIIILLWDFCGF